MFQNLFQCVGHVLCTYDLTESTGDDNEESQMRHPYSARGFAFGF